MELWYTEQHTDNVNFSLKVKKHLFSGQSEFQKLDILDTYEYGTLMTLDGLVMVTDKDEFVYHDMIVHVPMAVNPNIKNVLVIGGGDGGTVRELMRYKSIELGFIDISNLKGELTGKNCCSCYYCSKSKKTRNNVKSITIRNYSCNVGCYGRIFCSSSFPRF